VTERAESTPTVAARFRRWREGFRHRRTANFAYRLAVGLVGGVVLLVGVAAIPYPGPGWAIIIAGLAILASEFTWARRVLALVKRYYDGWTQWLRAQPKGVQVFVLALTAAVVALTLWLIGALGLIAGWLGFDQPWLQSPV